MTEEYDVLSVNDKLQLNNWFYEHLRVDVQVRPAPSSSRSYRNIPSGSHGPVPGGKARCSP